MSEYFSFIKVNIVFSTLLMAAIGFLYALRPEDLISWPSCFLFFTSLYLLSAGSLSLNQYQEQRVDSLMERTKKRPLVSGKISSFQAKNISFSHIFLGLVGLLWHNKEVFFLGILTLVLYNFFYTEQWKKYSPFAPVPGAIPGAMPILMGYYALRPFSFNKEAFYIFAVLFLWQMPHFWALAIKYAPDYWKAKIPVLPAALGVNKTILHTGLYLFCYILLIVLAPFFIQCHIAHCFLSLPFAVFILASFFKYSFNPTKASWPIFFIGINLSLPLFLGAGLLDKWFLFILGIVQL